jgi:beta-1,4-mannosyl-glycoprotein beta-1,4-N-acetylglucosaminyltransferase
VIFDCFMFYNEFDVLRLRLRELYAVVDRFVLTEATHTLTGKPKPLYFAEHREDFSEFADKIVHVVVDDMEIDPDPWKNEEFQRNAMLRGIDDLDLNDWILVSDVDEIPRASTIATLRDSPLIMAGFRMPLSYFKLNYVNIEGEPNSVWAMAVRPMALSTPQKVRNRRWNMMDPDFVASHPGCATFDRAG